MANKLPHKLIFIRHAAVEQIPGIPACNWPLSEDGRIRAAHLVTKLAVHRITKIVTSEESKAVETGDILAKGLLVPRVSIPGLQEHERKMVPFFDDINEFATEVSLFFNNPDRLVFGGETANQAYLRFKTAVLNLLNSYPTDTLALVTHGTVLSLFLAHTNQFDPFPFWQSLKLPDCFPIRLPLFELER